MAQKDAEETAAKQKEAETASKRREDMQQLLIDISSKFINLTIQGPTI